MALKSQLADIVYDDVNVKQEDVMLEAALLWPSKSPQICKAHISLLQPRLTELICAIFHIYCNAF